MINVNKINKKKKGILLTTVTMSCDLQEEEEEEEEEKEDLYVRNVRKHKNIAKLISNVFWGGAF